MGGVFMAKINKLYKYQFKEIYLMRGQQVLNLNWSNIKSLMIHKDFDGYIRPQYILTLQVDAKTDIWMSRYQNDFQVYLDVQKLCTDDLGKQISPATTFMKGLFISQNPTSSGVSIDRLENGNGTVLDASDTNDLTEMVAGQPVTIGLIQREMYNQSMSPCNTIVEKDNMQNTVASMFTRAGFKKVLMSPFSNPEVYEDFIIPPLELYKGIQYLDSKYTFYKEGAVIFYDFDTVYVIDSSMRNPVYKNGENPNVVLNIFESPVNAINGHVTDTVSRELYVAGRTTDIIYGEDFTTARGSTTSVIDVNTGNKTNTTYPAQNMQYLESKKVVYGNDKTAPYIKQRQLENKVKIIISGYHYDIDSFTPNILTSVAHTNQAIQKKIVGKYRISSMVTEIANQGDNFVAQSSVVYVYCGA
jgi:hypothetical protein